MPIFGLGKKKTVAQPQVAVPPARVAVPPPQVPVRPGLPGAHLDPTGGDVLMPAILGVAQSRDWPALRASLAEHSGEDQPTLVAKVCAESPGLSEWLPAALAGATDDALAMAVLGAFQIESAWKVRTGKRAQHVSRDQFKQFHEILREADESLFASVELDPESVTPWYSLLITARGLEVDSDVRQRRFEAAVKRCPGHLAVHRQMLQNLCEKWSGSHEQMHAFATGAMRGPDGGRLAELVPDAHIEHWHQLGDTKGGREYMQQADVRAELQEAADLTILRPGYECPRSPFLAANLFAMAFGLAGMWPQSAAAFEATQGVVVGRWTYMSGNEPVKFYTNWRNHVLSKV